MQITEALEARQFVAESKSLAIQGYLNQIEPFIRDIPPIPPGETIEMLKEVIRVGISEDSPDGLFRIDSGYASNRLNGRMFVLPSGNFTVFEGDPFWNRIDLKTRELLTVLGGNDVEVDTYSSRDLESEMLKGEEFWSRWKDQSALKRSYTQLIYPRVIERLLPEIAARRAEGGAYRVVELFGGDGEFAGLLEDKVAEIVGNRAAIMHIVDRDKASLEKARHKEVEQPGFIVHDPIDLTNQRKRRKLFSEIGACQIVTVIGGLNRTVTYTDDAYPIAYDICNSLLVPGGVCIVTGLSSVNLNRRMFSRAGFRVEQMSIPENILLRQDPRQLYVLRKPLE